MEFSVPAVHDIAVEIDGLTFEGSWYVVLGDMVVNYNGWTASTHRPTTDADEVAVEMLQELARRHYVPLDALPSSLPARVRIAAHALLNSFDDNQRTRELVSSLGESKLGSAVHRQLSWLCVNALGIVVPFWKLMCDTDTPEKTYLSLRDWLEDPTHEVDWPLAQTPAIAARSGQRVVDCDACRLEPIAEAVAKAAAYLHTADPSLAEDTLLSAAAAYDEGCHPQDSPDRFEKWLVFHALPHACQSRPLN